MQTEKKRTPSIISYTGLFLLSMATLAYQINLTRLFSVAQFYHFAFMIVSLALLGFGASGTFLAISPRFGREEPEHLLAWCCLATAAGFLGAYLLINQLPFDSFSVAWDLRQLGVLVLHYIALALPFFFSGLAVGILFAAFPQAIGGTYAINLLGSALGCAVALAAPPLIGGEGMVTLSCGLAALPGLILFLQPRFSIRLGWKQVGFYERFFAVLATLALLATCGYDLVCRVAEKPAPAWLNLRISPYKSLSYSLQYPGSELIGQRWNAISRVDMVRSAGIRSLPGLSYRLLEPPPAQDGLFVDGDDLSPVIRDPNQIEFTPHMPAAVAMALRPQAKVLVLEPRGGVDILIALGEGADEVIAVEENALIVDAAPQIYNLPNVQVALDTPRSFLSRGGEKFDIITLSMSSSYHPVTSGAYSLAEDYRYTVESFRAAISRLEEGGLLVVTRWLQVPPSEWLRAFALAVTALEEEGYDPSQSIVAYRSYNTGTLLLRRGAFTPAELQVIRQFTSSRAYDMVYAPDINEEEVNRYNILPQPLYYQAFTGLLAAPSRSEWYADYPYDVAPPVDDHPFFGQFFKWSQAGQVWAELGKTWQPFGGAGYFVLLLMLALALALAVVIILLPVAVARMGSANGQGAKVPIPSRQALAVVAYFGLIGLGFLLVEIPIIQSFILFLGQPSYAMTAVLFSLLLFSGLGSRLSHLLPLRVTLFMLLIVLAGLPLWLPAVLSSLLGASFLMRLGLTVIILAVPGFLMGTAFPGGMRLVQGAAQRYIPWAWAINGAASVVSAALAALLALSFGFRLVFIAGAACYVGAWLTIPTLTALVPRSRSPRQ